MISYLLCRSKNKEQELIRRMYANQPEFFYIFFLAEVWNRIRTKETWKEGGDRRKEDDETKTVTVTNGTITDTRTHICVNGTSNQRPQCWETSCDLLTLSLSLPVWFWREVGEIWTTFVPQIKQNRKQTTCCCTETNRVFWGSRQFCLFGQKFQVWNFKLLTNRHFLKLSYLYNHI